MPVLLLQRKMGKHRMLCLKLLKNHFASKTKLVANSCNSEKYLEAKIFTVP